LTGVQTPTAERFAEVIANAELAEVHADASGLTAAPHRASLELFQSDVAPALRRAIPDPPWGTVAASQRKRAVTVTAG